MAFRFVEDRGHLVRYCDDLGKWFCWDGSRWERDRTRQIWTLAEESIDLLVPELRSLVGDAKSYKNLEDLQEHMQKRSGVVNMLEFVKGRGPIKVSIEMLDADPWLLNVRNGTVDLRTGEFREARQADLITKQAAVSFDSAATCPQWLAFLERVFAGDQEVIRYVQRVVGYCLTGSVDEQAMFFCYGTGANGKTVLWVTVQDLLGDYAIQASSDLLTVTKGDKHPTDMAHLMGARLAMVTEIKRGRSLDESRMKKLTGGDKVDARFVRQDMINFDMQAKLVMTANHLPPVDTFDEGTWRRIFQIVFDVTIPKEERDRGLTRKLAKERSGILNWALEGLRDYRDLGGLEPPDSVTENTDGYREEMDIFGRFISECCLLLDGAKVRPNDLRKAYCAWAAGQGYGPRSIRWISGHVRDRGIVKGPVGGYDYYKGIGLLVKWEHRAKDWSDKEK
jgi:putative DNA primase/helicase